MQEQRNAPVEQPDVSATLPETKVEQTVKETVSRDHHRQVLDEKKKVQQERDLLLKEKQDREEADAKKRGDYEALLKARDEELLKEREKRTQLEASFVQGQKLNAVIDALGGQLESKWFRLIDVSQVLVNPDTGEVDAMTAAKVAEGLRKEWPEMVKQTGKLPIDAPKGIGNGKISHSEWLKLPHKEMAKWKPSQIED